MLRRTALLLLTLTLLVPTGFAKDKNNEPDALSNVSFTVVKDDNSRPVRNASVILHPVGKDGKQSKGGYQLKTDSEGKTVGDSVPYGTVRVQVIASGLQTFGDDYIINQPQMDIEIRLKRPQDQLTIYNKAEHQQGSSGQAPPK